MLRDRKPLIEAGLTKALQGSMTNQKWVNLLNDHVFFTCRSKDPDKLLQAVAATSETHVLLRLDTRSLIKEAGERIRLCTFNPGFALRNPVKRNRASLQSIQDYDGEIGSIREFLIQGSLDQKQLQACKASRRWSVG